MENPSFVRWLPVLFLSTLITSCWGPTLPNVAPFVDATAGLRNTLHASGAVVEDELRAMDGGSRYADQLNEAWKSREAATIAFVEYSIALRNIVDAGDDGEKAVATLVDAATTLTQQVNVSLTSPLLNVATDIGKFVYSQIARARAAKKLQEALQHTGPAIARIAEVLAADVRDLDEILQLAIEHARLQLTDSLNVELGFRRRLLADQRQLYQKETLTEDDKGRLVEIGVLLEGTNAWYQPYLAKALRIEERLSTSSEIVHAASAAARDWGRAHGELAIAVMDESPLDMSHLLQSARQVEDLIRRVRSNLTARDEQT